MDAMGITTIKLSTNTKAQLDLWRENKSESYDEVIRKVVFIARNAKRKPQLSKETVEAIERARERMRRGEYFTEAEARKRLGL
jgi:DNA replicative helicase MCM subunit Mcm2 (Cdc46/Mcm family)